jgi:cellulose synthase/poly-beta-1,6-N-acetylglucosamine synthase-like glycosyltransferase
MVIIWAMVSLVLFVMLFTVLLNLITFTRLIARPPELHAQATLPPVSILVPARNEATVIGETIAGLLALDYPDFEVLILDDDSTDGTAEIARAAAGDAPNLRIIQGMALPPGWLGKSWACHQLSGHARADLLIFADADVHWHPAALRSLVEAMQHHRADMLTVWPTQIMNTWAERLTVGLIMLVVGAYLPEIATRIIPGPLFAAANGQVIAFRRQVYLAIGGHSIVRDKIVEDVALARAVKKPGYKLMMVLGNRLISTRMYDGWPAIRDGFAKNILAGHGGLFMLLLSMIFHLLVFVAPWLWLALGGLLPHSPMWPVVPLILGLSGAIVRALTAALAHQPLLDGLLMPLSALLMTLITIRAVRWHLTGQTRWKGRTLIPPQANLVP